MTVRENNSISEREKHNASFQDRLVQLLVNEFRDAFNRHDPKIFASLLVEDAEWTDVTGTTTAGRKEIEQLHIYPFQTVLKEATLDVKSFRNKWISDNIVSIEIKWESIGHRTSEGVLIPNVRYGLLNLIATKLYDDQGEQTLKIISAHNNDYTSTFTLNDREKVVD